MAYPFEIITPLALGSSLKRLITIKLDHLFKGLGINAATLQFIKGTSCNFPLSFPTSHDSYKCCRKRKDITTHIIAVLSTKIKAARSGGNYSCFRSKEVFK